VSDWRSYTAVTPQMNMSVKQCATAGCAEQPSLVHRNDNLPAKTMFEYFAAVDCAPAMLQRDGRI